MAELEALTEIRPAAGRTTVSTLPTGQFGRRFPLVVGHTARLGRDETKMDWAVPEDDQISRFYAVLKWDGAKLAVERRGSVPPDYPEPPANKIIILNKEPGSKER